MATSCRQVLSLILALTGAMVWGGVARGQTIRAITIPSEDRTLSFSRPGSVVNVLVHEGDVVKVGQDVAQQDSREEEAAIAVAKSERDDMTEIRVEEALRDQKKTDLTKVQWAAKQGAKSPFELDEAKMAVVVEEARLQMAQLRQLQAGLKFEQIRVVLDKCTLRSPIAGRVERIMVHGGESVEPMTKVVRIVTIDPLRIDVPVPAAQARALQIGQKATVVFPDQKPATGEITFIGAEGDAASDTLRVTLTVPNKMLRPVGEQVQIELPGGGKIAQAPALTH